MKTNTNIIKHLKNNQVDVSVNGNDILFNNIHQKKTYKLSKSELGVHLKENITEDKFKGAIKILIDKLKEEKTNDENYQGIITILNKIN